MLALSQSSFCTLQSEICNRRRRRGFTLLELILVMVIIAIVAGAMVPALNNFRVGRGNANLATQLIGLASYARSQAASEGRTYRINFDDGNGAPGQGQFWLTYLADDGSYQPAAGDYGQKFSVSPGTTMQVTVEAQANSNMTIPANVQQASISPNPPVQDPNASSNANNQLMQNVRDPKDGTYVEIQPSGRTDQVVVTLTDRTGGSIRVGCPSATETFHVLQPGEMVQ